MNYAELYHSERLKIEGSENTDDLRGYLDDLGKEDDLLH